MLNKDTLYHNVKQPGYPYIVSIQTDRNKNQEQFWETEGQYLISDNTVELTLYFPNGSYDLSVHFASIGISSYFPPSIPENYNISLNFDEKHIQTVAFPIWREYYGRETYNIIIVADQKYSTEWNQYCGIMGYTFTFHTPEN